MKKVHDILSILFLLLSQCTVVSSQTQSHNYVLSRTMLNGDGTRSISNLVYYDGLGSPTETVTNGLGGYGKSVYSLLEYNVPGLASTDWGFGATGTGLDYLSESALKSLSSSFHKDAAPYTSNTYDGLGREVSVLGPGENWHTAGKAVNKSYGANVANSVRYYQAPLDGNSLVEKGYYSAGTLSVEKTTDEDGKTMEVFTDVLGRKVLERRDGGNDTYFVYDDRKRLRFVLSPEYQENPSLEKLAYEYRYDGYGRCVWKRLPGCEYQQMWYDENDNLMFSQDGEQRKSGCYVFYLYDKLNRLVVSGTTKAINASCPSARTIYNRDVSGICGSGYAAPENMQLSDVQLLLATYYDDYDFLNLGVVKHSCGYDLKRSTVAPVFLGKGKETGTIVMTSTGEPLVSVNYYNNLGLVLESKQSLPGGGLMDKHQSYTFTKKPLSETIRIQRDGFDRTLVKEWSYNAYNDQPSEVYVKAGNTKEKVLGYSYDDIGRLSMVGRTALAGYKTQLYNVRGWLTTLSTPKFCETLNYETGSAHPCYNGSISRMQWSTGNDWVTRGYDFDYDNLGRLLSSEYAEGASMNTNKGRYSELLSSYSPNGSIGALQRYGKTNAGTFGLVDNLTLSYDGNQLQSISDKAGSLVYAGSVDFKDGANETVEYGYDANGALVKDLNRGIASITYDIMGNPQEVTFKNGNKTKYVYTMSGEKLKVIHETAVVSGYSSEISSQENSVREETEYVGDFVFENGVLSKYLFGGGYYSFSSQGYPTLHYYEQDHLGNNRMVINANGMVEQVTHYYPFGGIISDLSMNADLQQYKYNGKELDLAHGLNTYDYGARQLSLSVPIWDRVDPLCEETPSVNPYAYCENNPVNAFDKDGCSSWTKIAKVVVKIGKRVVKQGVSALGQTATYADAASDVVNDVNVLRDNNSSTWEKVGAGFSLASEILPVSVNDVKDASKLFQKTKETVQRVHGNSKISTKAQHAYDIIDTKTNRRVKTGVSGGRIRKDGKSYRAESQVRRWNKEAGEDGRYQSEITHREPAGKGARDRILEYEKRRAHELKPQLEKNKHKRP